MRGKISLGILALFIVSMLAASVSAVPVTIDKVKVNGVEATGPTFVLEEDRNQELDVKVYLTGTGNASDVEVSAYIAGYEYNDKERISDIVDIFDVEQGVSYVKKLKLRLPQKLDRDRYSLRILVDDRTSDSTTTTFNLKVDTSRHSLVIKDAVFSPAFSVQAGRALLATARIKNYGEKDEEGVKVTLAIPELNVAASDYIDEVEDGEETTSEELYIRIPNCAKAGQYLATVSVEYDEGYETESKEYTVNVADGGVCEESPAAKQSDGKTIIAISTEAQNVVKGTSGAIYPLTLSNTGSAAKTFTVAVSAGDWADVSVSPSNVIVLNGGESKAVYVHVAAKANAAAGEQAFGLAIKSGDQTLKEILVKANVVGDSAPATASGWSKVKRGLEIGLVVLVVLLVILGLIIGFNRLKEGDDEEPGEGQTYY